MLKKRKMASGFGKIFVCMLSAVFTFGCVSGCAQKSDLKPTESPATVWFAPATQKIRPLISKTEYASIAETKLDIQTGKAEYESGQIIVTATHNVKSYDLELSDLTLEGNASVTFSKENIQVYNQKYINVEQAYEYDDPKATRGEYPDALIPMDKAKKFGENSITLGAEETERNQGIWVTFHTPLDTTAGKYVGNFKLTIDGETVNVPVSFTVWDFDFAQNYTARNCFLYENSYIGWGELDTSQDMYDAYGDALLEFRVQPHILVSDLDICKDEDIEFYADEVLRRASDPRCTVVFVPFKLTAYYQDGFDTRLHDGYMEKMIDAYVERSLSSYDPQTETGVNIVAKTMTYFTFIDEPQMANHLEARTQEVMRRFKKLRSDISAKYAEKYVEDCENITDAKELAFRKEVYDAIDGIRSAVTAPYLDELNEVETFCPLIDEYDTAEKRALYADDDMRWWYTAVGPKYPYPSYHIDNTDGLMSARLMSWMQADYDVIGNLYFMVTNYRYSPQDGNDRFLEDAYASAARSYLEVNGDGFLFYPGKRYGMNEPIASIRLHSIRDGLEEYETLTALKGIYRNISKECGDTFDFSEIYARMSETLYEGTKCRTRQEFFDRSRELMANLAVLADMGGVVSDVEIKLAEEKITMELVLPENLTMDAGETVKTEAGLANGYKKYVLEKDFSDSANAFEVKISSDTKSIDVNVYLGGKITAKNVAEMISGISIPDGNELTENDIQTVPAAGEEELLSLALPATDEETRQQVIFGGSDFMQNFGSQTQKVVFRFYYAGEEDLHYVLQFLYANDPLYIEITSGTIRHGWNEITINNLYAYSWEKMGALKNMRFLIGSTEADANSDLYFGGATVYYI